MADELHLPLHVLREYLNLVGTDVANFLACAMLQEILSFQSVYKSFFVVVFVGFFVLFFYFYELDICYSTYSLLEDSSRSDYS